MRVHQKRKDCWLLILEPREDEETVVEAFARVSFEMAKPAGISALTSFDPSVQWQDVRTEALRKQKAQDNPTCLLGMDYVAGRRCKTEIWKLKKCLAVYPGSEREQEMETMYLLAMKYLVEGEYKVKSAVTVTDRIQ